MNGCKIPFENALGAVISDEELKRYERLTKRFTDSVRDAGYDPKMLMEGIKAGSPNEAVAKVNGLLDQIVKKEATGFARDAARKIKSEGKLMGAIDRIDREAAERGKQKIDIVLDMISDRINGGQNLEGVYRAVQATWLGGLNKRLDEVTGGRWSALLGDKRVRDAVALEYQAIHLKQPRATKNDDAFKIAQAYHDTRNRQRATLNSLGSRRHYNASGLPMRLSFNSAKADKAGFIAALADALDETTHGSEARRTQVAQAVYDRLEANKGIIDFDQLGDALGDHAPVLNFGSGEKWIAFNDRFGDSDIGSIITAEVMHMRKKEAAMRMFGPDADANLTRLIRHAKGSSGKSNRARANYERLTKTHIPDSILLSRTLGTGRNLEVASKLGGAIVSALGDPVALVYSHNMFYSVGVFRTISRLLDGFSKTNRDHAKYILAPMEAMNSYAHERFGVGSSLDDKMSRGSATLADWVMRASGLNIWTEMGKAAGVGALDMEFADHIGKAWSELPRGFRYNLERQGMTPAEWGKVKKAYIRNDGRFDPMMMPDESTSGVTTKQKILALYVQAVENGILTPSHRDQELIGFNQVPGSVGAELMKTLAQFQSFALTAHRKLIYRTFVEKGITPQGRIAGLASFMLFSMAVNTVIVQAREVMKGNNPYEWDSTELYQKAAQGLPYGLMVDLVMKLGGQEAVNSLIGVDTKYGSSSNTDLLGPLIKDGAAIINGTAKLVGEHPEKGLNEITQTILNLVPGKSLWEVQALYRKLILDTASDWIDPQTTRRSKRTRDQNARGQRMGNRLEGWIRLVD